jgi:hypothetical protein
MSGVFLLGGCDWEGRAGGKFLRSRVPDVVVDEDRRKADLYTDRPLCTNEDRMESDARSPRECSISTIVDW